MKTLSELITEATDNKCRLLVMRCDIHENERILVRSAMREAVREVLMATTSTTLENWQQGKEPK